MKEKLRHIEAFEYYYSLGDKRNLNSVAVHYKFSERSMAKWSKNFNWQERIEQRDIANAKSLEKKTNKTIVNTRADYRAEIKTQLSILKAILNNVIKEIKAHNIIDVNIIQAN